MQKCGQNMNRKGQQHRLERRLKRRAFRADLLSLLIFLSLVSISFPQLGLLVLGLPLLCILAAFMGKTLGTAITRGKWGQSHRIGNYVVQTVKVRRN